MAKKISDVFYVSKTQDRHRKMGLKGDIEALADARRALKMQIGAFLGKCTYLCNFIFIQFVKYVTLIQYISLLFTHRKVASSNTSHLW